MKVILLLATLNLVNIFAYAAQGNSATISVQQTDSGAQNQNSNQEPRRGTVKDPYDPVQVFIDYFAYPMFGWIFTLFIKIIGYIFLFAWIFIRDLFLRPLGINVDWHMTYMEEKMLTTISNILAFISIFFFFFSIFICVPAGFIAMIIRPRQAIDTYDGFTKLFTICFLIAFISFLIGWTIDNVMKI